MNLLRLLAAFAITGVAGAGEAADWQYWFGVHDFAVPDVDSHTYGVDGGVSVDERTSAGRHLFGSFDLFVDHDKDDLDPDHIPIWWKVHAGSDGDFWKPSAQTHLGWTADVNTRMNTVSSVEREITAFPALVAGYDGDVLRTSLRAGAGWFFLEIDDDVPKTRGYDRSDFRNSTVAYELAADAAIRIGASWTVSGEALEWWDSHEWLQTQYKAALQVETGHWIRDGKLVLSAEFNEYNLDVYNHPGALPILPWDDDLFIRVSLIKAWRR